MLCPFGLDLKREHKYACSRTEPIIFRKGNGTSAASVSDVYLLQRYCNKDSKLMVQCPECLFEGWNETYADQMPSIASGAPIFYSSLNVLTSLQVMISHPGTVLP